MVSSLTPYPRCVGIFAGLPTLHVSACFCNQDTHFNDNDKGLKIYRQETKKSKQWTLLITQTFFEVTSLLCQTQAHSDIIWEGFQFKKKLFKKPRRSQFLKRSFGEVSFIYLFVSNHWEVNTYMIWIYVLARLGEETWWTGIPVDKAYNSL